MPVPLPGADTVLLRPPDAEEVAMVSRGAASGAAPSSGLTAPARSKPARELVAAPVGAF